MKVNNKKMMAMKTEFNVSAPGAKNVFLVGDFNQWNPSTHPLKQKNKQDWTISISLDKGQYQYRFVIDGEWKNDPKCSAVVENPFGTTNCLKVVG